jgi:nucleoid-associated protein YgaU
MARYKSTKTTNIEKYNLKKKYQTTLYVSVPEKNDDEYFIAQEGDRCDNLAHRFYGDPALWWFIARINNLKTMNIPAGTSLRIPASVENARGF